MTPTIGRIVHFYDHGMEVYTQRLGPYAAIVTFVHEDGSVDVQPFGQGSMPSYDEQTHRVIEGQKTSDQTSWWEWPPRAG